VEFRRRLADGTYQELVGKRLAATIKEAAQAAGVDDEIGALRVVMARLLGELQTDRDPLKVAGAIVRIAAATIAAQRAKRLISGQAADDLTDAISTILEELEAGR
jgi:hypothetical protein